MPGTKPASRRRFRLGKLIFSLVALVVALIWIFPVYWMVNSSLLPNTVLQSMTLPVLIAH